MVGVLATPGLRKPILVATLAVLASAAARSCWPDVRERDAPTETTYFGLAARSLFREPVPACPARDLRPKRHECHCRRYRPCRRSDESGSRSRPPRWPGRNPVPRPGDEFQRQADGRLRTAGADALEGRGRAEAGGERGRQEDRYALTAKDITNAVGADIHLGPDSANGPLVVKLFPVAGAAGEEGSLQRRAGRRHHSRPPTSIGPLKGSPLSDLVDEIRDGNSYTNIHTTTA